MKNNLSSRWTLVLLSLTLLLLPSHVVKAKGGDALLEVLQESMDEEFGKYSEKELPLYYMNYRVYDITATEISSSMGAITKSIQWKRKFFTATTRVGGYDFDNYHITKETPPNASSRIMLPLDNTKGKVIKTDISRLIKDAYTGSVTDYNKKKTIVEMSPEKDTVTDFTHEDPNVYYEAPLPESDVTVDMKLWEERLKRLSAIYKSYPDVFDGRVHLEVRPMRKYLVSSEKSSIVENELFILINITATTKDSDGNFISLSKMWRPQNINELPSEDEIKQEMLKLIDKQARLKQAPFADPYSGPILFSNQAAAVFFHEIFGHRVEAHRFKWEDDGQTFKNKLGELVLPEDFNVYMDPTIEQYKGNDLFGSYHYDDEGIKGQKVTLVKNGKLNDFLYNRIPVEGNLKSNGHGRADIGFNAVSRQSNLIVESSNLLSASELRAAFIEELKAKNKEFGYYIDEVNGGLTMTGRMLPNSFNVFPIITYKVFVDGRPDEMVRGVNIIGTPLSIFSNVIKAGEDKSEPFSGMCGADSGWLRVSAVSPMLLVKDAEVQKAMTGNNKPFITPRPQPRTSTK